MSETTPAIGISLSVSPSDGRSVVFQAHVGRDEDQSVLNAVVDNIYNAAERLVNRAAAASLGIIIEKIGDDFEDQTRAYLANSESVSGMEATLESLMPGDRERGSVAAKREMTELAAKINAARDNNRTYLVNKEAHEHTLKRLLAKQAVHTELAK